MKALPALLTVAAFMVSCSRSGTTIANDDSVIHAQVSAVKAANAGKVLPQLSAYPITEKDLTDEVRTAFYNRYPGAQNTRWLLLSDGNYQADFFIGKIRWKVIYEPDGTLVHEEHT